ncbi:methyltransferase domain-containing protein [Paraburkholderia sp. B3]|uniref:methyltransferase domain-containing protein n=1 Tax=Paraburkholderia sp. B3 TaxID=3134791 RepID=UPI003981D272
MAEVSILIPAFRPDFLLKALASAHAQTFKDIEILVGDDTADGRLRDVVAQVEDRRIQYFHHGFGNGLRNCQTLWQRATGRYVKWLYDDDLLMPTSVEVLVQALRAHPQAALAFHDRVLIDQHDQIVHTPQPLINSGDMALLDRRFLVQHMIAPLNNFIGEPSNVMLVRDRLDIATAMSYRSEELDFLTDVATFLNSAEAGPVVAVRGYHSCFRRHSGQNSSGQSPFASAGFYEWEIFVRGEAAAGQFTPEQLEGAKQKLLQFYLHALGNLKLAEIQPLLLNLSDLTEIPPQQLFDSPKFQANIAHARSVVAARRKAGSAPNVCSVCDCQVGEWQAHPQANSIDLEFLAQVESVGSRLDKHLCPACHCNDRDRHLWLYLKRAGLLDGLSGKRVLHIAPEGRIEPRIRALEPLEYVTGDLHPRLPHHVRINVEALDFPDHHFDLIVCNHVLEHVDAPEAALAEFKRCLAPNGHLVAQTPYSPLLKHTFELNRRATGAFATRYFGQDDHVRLFGADIVNRFRVAGLNGDLYAHETVLPGVDADRYGVNAKEPFFLFANGPAPQFVQASQDEVEKAIPVV